MNEAIHTEQYKNYTIEIYPDLYPESPREWDNLCVLHCWHKNINLGDENYYLYNESDEYWLNKNIKDARNNGDIVLPLYIYQHSGVVLSLGSFAGKLPQGHYEFDSGQVGYLVIPKKKAIEEFGNKIMTKKVEEKALKVAEGEIKTYNQYLAGDIYGYKILNENGKEIDDGSCWGFYGLEYTLAEAKSIVDYEIENYAAKGTPLLFEK